MRAQGASGADAPHRYRHAGVTHDGKKDAFDDGGLSLDAGPSPPGTCGPTGDAAGLRVPPRARDSVAWLTDW